jgi:hypothetical protein
MRTFIICLLLLNLSGCAKFDHKIATRVKGTVKYADGSPASGVYVKLVQVLKTYEEVGSTAYHISVAMIVETDYDGSFDFKFKDSTRPEGYPKDFSDYFLCISREFVDSNQTGKNIGMLSTETEVEFLRTINYKTGDAKNKIKTGRKNKIDAIIKN